MSYNVNDLLLPLNIRLAFTGLCVYGARLNQCSRNDVFSIRDAIEFKVAPDIGVFSTHLYIFAALTCLVSVVISLSLFRQAG